MYRLLTVLLVVAAAATSGATTLSDLVANGAALSGHTVTVVGSVADPKAGYAGETTYTITDGEQRLAIFGKGDTPPVGQRLAVTGTVGFKAPDEEFTWPPVLLHATWQPAP